MDVRWVVVGGSWTFNNHVLIFKRMQEEEDPCRVELNSLFIWVQVHNLPAGYRSERVMKSIGQFLGGFTKSDTNNFIGN